MSTDGSAPVPASTSHVTNTAIGMIAGGLLTGAVLAVAGPFVAPVAAIAAAVGIPMTVAGMGLGGWLGYSKADKA